MECSDIISRSLNFVVRSSHFMNTLSLPRQNFPTNPRRAQEYFQLQSMFNSIGSINVVLK